MDAHIKKVYVPMTETGFYILLCLRSPNHGYGIVQKVKEITDNEVILGPGTMYGSLSKMEKDGSNLSVKKISEKFIRLQISVRKFWNWSGRGSADCIAMHRREWNE